MADFKYDVSLDDRSFIASQRRMEKAAERTGRSASRSLATVDKQMTSVRAGADRVLAGFAGFATAERAISVAKRSMSEYARVTEETSDGTRALNEAMAEFNVSLGRDLTSAAGQGAASLAGIVRWMNSARETSADFVANVLRLSAFSGNDVGAVNQARQDAEVQNLNAATRQNEKERRRQLEIDLLRAQATEESKLQAEILQAEADFQRKRAENAKKQEELNKRKGALGAGTADNFDVTGLNDIAEAERDARVKAARDAFAAAAEAKKEASERERDQINQTALAEIQAQKRARDLQRQEEERDERDRRRSAESFAFDSARRAIEIEAVKGNTRDADLAEIELDRRERILDVRRDESATEQERERRIAEIQRQSGARLEAEQGRQARESREVRSVRSLTTGLSSSIALGQTLGAGRAVAKDPIVPINMKMRDLLQKIDQTLVDIKNNGGDGMVAL